MKFLMKNKFGIKKKELAIMCLSSVKGYLSIILSIIILEDQYLPIRFKEITVFLIAGTVTFTQIFNGIIG